MLLSLASSILTWGWGFPGLRCTATCWTSGGCGRSGRRLTWRAGATAAPALRGRCWSAATFATSPSRAPPSAAPRRARPTRPGANPNVDHTALYLPAFLPPARRRPHAHRAASRCRGAPCACCSWAAGRRPRSRLRATVSRSGLTCGSRGASRAATAATPHTCSSGLRCTRPAPSQAAAAAAPVSSEEVCTVL